LIIGARADRRWEEIAFDKYILKGYILLMWLVFVLLFLPVAGHGYDRIISLSPQITESIYLLGAERSLLGVTDLCKRPPEAMTKEKVGTPLRPDVEKIVSMRPDMVLGTREGNSPLVMARLERLGVKGHYFDRPRTLKDLLDNFLTLSKIVGKEEKGRRIAEIAQEVLPKITKDRNYRVLWQVGATPLIVASNNSFANDIIRFAGGKNVVESELPYPRINVEEVILKAPHIIVLMDMGYNVQIERERWRKYLGNVQFVIMDAYSVGSPTPVSFVEAVNRLAGVIRTGEVKPSQ
jgi:iron complex transport system substrate-binding protein